MVSKVLVLMLFLSLVTLTGLPASAGQAGCLTCHQGHYPGRGGCVTCHHGNERTTRKQVAHDGLIPARFAWFTIPGSEPVVRGKRLVNVFACRRCHVVAGKGNRLATNLDRSAAARRPGELAHAIQSPAEYMPDFRFADREVADLVNALLAAAPATVSAPELPLVVHFQRMKEKENIFERQCGGCHRALTSRTGALGRGNAGPNLSGLFTPFYPASRRGRERWSVAGLRQWLANPRQLKEHSLMRPVPLASEDFAGLSELLRDE